ncbi:maleylpyruvate isomerase family mycothiol-dependent enzyme [Geodermatophilus sp. SYSU D00815]
MSRPPLLHRDAVWAVIDEERGSLADLLDDLSPDEWAHPSLCRAWRVRDVAAHVTFSVARPGEVLGPALRARGRFHRMTRDAAVRRAAATPTDELVARIRAMAGSRRVVPGLTPYEPLIDVLVHGQDIAVPLGRPRPVPVGAAATAATRIWTMRWPFTLVFDARRRLAGLRLVATDTEWSAGEGALVEGPMAALLLLLTGRTAVAVDRLSGPGAERLSPAPR